MGQTIQIYMPNDEPRGVRIASVTTRIIQAVIVPRRRLAEAITRPELSNVAMYCLFGDSVGGVRGTAYIGETENVPARMRYHHANKEFWNTAVIVVAEARFTKAHVKYLEWYCLSKARDAGRYELDNSNEPAEPFLPEPQIDDCQDAFTTIDTLLSTLGFPIFEPARTSATEISTVFYCRRGQSDARGELTDEGFVVFAGSRAALDETASASSSVTALRRRLIDDGIMVLSNGSYLFQHDHVFTSPSAAAASVAGSSANGWLEWKDAEGHTLDEVYRQDAGEAVST